jgi:hypothetical protein
MFLVAQRVVSPTTGRDGINAFLYSHPDGIWSGPPPQEILTLESGRLINQLISVPPPGNRVRSFLDIAAPDDLQWPSIQADFVTFASPRQASPFPWTATVGSCHFGLSMEEELAKAWKEEVANLYRMALTLRLSTTL